MRHRGSEEQLQEQIVLYVLGALSQLEASALEQHIAEGCSDCEAQIRLFESVVGTIGLASPVQEPPSRVRERLVAVLIEEHQRRPPRSDVAESAYPQLQSVRVNEGEWREISQGVSVKLLFVDQPRGQVTSLVKMKPGTRLPRHQHLGTEQFFVLEGDCHVHGDVLGPGDYHRAAAGSIHESTYTVGGTLFLLVAPKDYEVLEPH